MRNYIAPSQPNAVSNLVWQELHDEYSEELRSWCLMELNLCQLCTIKLLHGLITHATDYPELTCTTANSQVLTQLVTASIVVERLCVKCCDEFGAITCHDLSLLCIAMSTSITPTKGSELKAKEAAILPVSNHAV